MTESTPLGIDSGDPRQVDIDVELNPMAEFEDEDVTPEDTDARSVRLCNPKCAASLSAFIQERVRQ